MMRRRSKLDELRDEVANAAAQLRELEALAVEARERGLVLSDAHADTLVETRTRLRVKGRELNGGK